MNLKIPLKKHLSAAFILVMLSFPGLFSQVTVQIKNKTIKEALKEIESKSDYKFFYNNNLESLNKNVSLDVEDQSIDKVLTHLLTDTNITWKPQSDHVILLVGKSVHSAKENQGKKITGLVKDADTGEPLIGVSVTVKGTGVGTITNYDGEFSIEAPLDATLVFSYLGYTTAEEKVTTQTLNVNMYENTTGLDEVVVIGYGTQRKGDITTTVTTVSTKGLDERPIVSAAAAIQGKAAGVEISQPTGQPGEGLRVRIRGNTSINASSSPLYVVDGVPMSDIQYLSPSDIESITILKDAASSAIYGSMATNGVVLIGTKKGVKGEAKIEFNSYVGLSKVSHNFKSLNTAQYRELMNEIGLIQLPEHLTDRTDWFKETYRTGLTQNYQVTISNAQDKFNYNISGGYQKDKGVINVAFFERYNFRMNMENEIRSWFKVTGNVSYADYTDNGIITGTGANRAGVVLSVINTPTYAPIWSEKPGEEGWYYYDFYGANITSPVSNMSRSADNRNKNSKLIGSFSGQITFMPGLIFKSTISMDRTNTKTNTWLDPVKTSYGRSQWGVATDTRSDDTRLIFDNIFNFNKTIQNAHGFDITAGSSGITSKWSQSYMTASHFGNWGIHTLNAGNKIEQNSGTVKSDWALMSYLARLAYNFDSKYLFSASIRADGSSKFSKDHRWGYFPSVSAGWRISSEKFMSNQQYWLNDLKLRGAWGKVGNTSGIGDYAAYSSTNITRQPWWEEGKANALPAISATPELFNPDLTWETTAQTNFGLDVVILNGRLSATIDWYYKKTTDLLLRNTIPSGSYYTSQVRNSGEMVNKGFEFSVSSTNLTGIVEWDSQFNISFNRNKYTKAGFTKITPLAQVSEVTNEYIVRLQEGKPLGMFWGYISDGVDPETGDIIYRDLNGDGRVTSSDKTFIGNPNPKFTFGLTNNLSYKNFNLNFLITGSYGNDIFNASRMETEGMYNGNNQTTVVLDRWKRPGMITDVPRAVNSTENLKASTRWIEDGSFIRLKNISLSYNIKTPLLTKLGIEKAQFYVTASNLVTFTKYSGFDPEVNQYGNSSTVLGIDFGTYPQSRSYVGGFNLNF